MKTLTPSILPATLEHLPAIAALAQVIWTAHYPGIITHEQIMYMLKKMYDSGVLKEELAKGICYDRALIGRAMRGFTSYGPWQGNRQMKLYKLYIHPNFQRRGIGSMLMRHVEQVAKKRGFESIFLTVNRENEPAINAYRKNGFAITDTSLVDIGQGFVMDDFIMTKNLR